MPSVDSEQRANNEDGKAEETWLQKTVSADSGSTLRTLRNLWPYMWPADRPDLRARVVWATVLLVVAKLTLVVVPYFFKWATDALAGDFKITAAAAGLHAGAGDAGRSPTMLVRIVQGGFNQLRDALFARVGQYAVRKLAFRTFVHLHELSLRFHLERRTGGLSRVIERGVKGIETIVRFTMLATAPTILEFALTAAIFAFAYGWLYVVVIAVTVWLYIWFTVRASNWRISIRREMNESDTDANTKAIDSLLNYETVKYFNNERHGGRALRPLDGALRGCRHQDLDLARLAELRARRDLRARHDHRHVAVGARGHRRHADRRRFRVRQRHADAAVAAAQFHRHDLSRDPPGPHRHRADVRPARREAGDRRPPGRHAARRRRGQGRVPRRAFRLRSGAARS